MIYLQEQAFQQVIDPDWEQVGLLRSIFLIEMNRSWTPQPCTGQLRVVPGILGTVYLFKGYVVACPNITKQSVRTVESI